MLGLLVLVWVVELAEGVLHGLVLVDKEEIVADCFEHGLVVQNNVVPEFCLLEMFFDVIDGKLVEFDGRVLVQG